MTKLLTFASTLAVIGILGLSAAQAGSKAPGTSQFAGSNNPVIVTDKGKIHINQNGDGCRNRCYGEQTFNAGFNNGNTNVNVNGLHKGWVHHGWAP